ncbi:hypothetical protein AB4Y77_01485 [Paenarthrobacter sp. YAF11_1]|uniref:hypothetical protein n=1 Tax=Paenarthrobacter sp. YAF11_1 TaxID=3233074 RepID=UPI003F9A69FB
MDKTEALNDLRQYEAARQQSEEDVRQCVGRARELGASWAEIGAMLGVTRQAAQQRFAELGASVP